MGKPVGRPSARLYSGALILVPTKQKVNEQLEPVRVAVDHVVLGEQVRHREEGRRTSEHDEDDHLGIGDLALAQVRDVLGHIVGHLRR